MFEWIDCFGGPADGETVPVDPVDPLPDFPYMTIDQEVHYYNLRQHTDGRLRFFYNNVVQLAGWQPYAVEKDDHPLPD